MNVSGCLCQFIDGDTGDIFPNISWDLQYSKGYLFVKILNLDFYYFSCCLCLHTTGVLTVWGEKN